MQRCRSTAAMAMRWNTMISRVLCDARIRNTDAGASALTIGERRRDTRGHATRWPGPLARTAGRRMALWCDMQRDFADFWNLLWELALGVCAAFRPAQPVRAAAGPAAEAAWI